MPTYLWQRFLLLLSYLWQRFLLLGWVGKLFTIFAVLYGFGWIVGSLGADSAARQFGSAGAVVLAVLITALVIRLIWRNYAGRPSR